MSKYIEAIPLTRVERLAVARGNGRSLKQVKSASGAGLVMNGGFYDMGTGKPTNHLKSGGAVLSAEPWGCWGFAWDTGADIRMEALPARKRGNYIGGVELLSPMTGHGDKPRYGGSLGGKRGRTALALTGDKLILYCSGDGTKDAATPEALQDELYRLGAETAIMLDGGGSSQCDFGGGKVISSARRVNNYICVWLKEEQKGDKPMDGIIQNFMTRNDCYKAGRMIKPEGIMVHSTASPGRMAAALRDEWDAPGVDKAVHAFVDDTGVIQALPWDRRGWHAGTGSGGRSANNTHIAFEICEPSECRLLPIEWVPLYRGNKSNPVWAVRRLQQELTARGYETWGVDGSFGPGCEAALKKCQKDMGITVDGSCGPATKAALAAREGSYLTYDPQETDGYFRAAWCHAVALCAKLCMEYGFDPLTDILCHSEGYKAGIASNHADVMHWFPQHNESMDSFRAAVKRKMEGGKPADPLSVAVDKLISNGVILPENVNYWKGDNYSAANVQALIIKMAANF